MRTLRGAALGAAAAASGVACGLTFPLVDAKALAWVGLVPFLLALRGARLAAAPLLALAWSLGLWGTVWDWGPGAVVAYFGQPVWVGVAIFLWFVFWALFPAVTLFACAYRLLARRFSASLPLWAAAAWAASELLRSRLVEFPFPFGNPWAALGYSQVGVDSMLQLASVTGIYGVSFVLATVNAAWAEIVLARRAGAGGFGAPLRSAGVAGLVVAATLAHGVVTLRSADREATRDESVAVGVVQPNLDPIANWSPGDYGKNLAVYLHLSRALATAESLDLLLWPESAMTFFVEEEPDHRRAIASHLLPLDLELAAGAPRLGEEAFWNSFYLLSPSGEIRGRYDKRLLIPFAEYVPFEGFDLLRRRFGQIREYRVGAAQPPLATRAGAAGVLICNEAMFSELAAERVAQGAEILINAAHDGWIPSAEYAEQQLQLAVVRAVEQRRFLIRASTSGPSAIVDPWGRTLARTRPFTEATLAGRVAPRTDRTWYARLGNAFALTCGVATLIGLWLARRAIPPSGDGAPSG